MQLIPSRKNASGIALIEVLISIAIASIGLLALAGVSVSSLRYTKMSQYRGTATQLAGDIAERIRANKLGLAGYDSQANFVTQTAVLANTLRANAVTSDALCDAVTKTCTANQIAAADLDGWKVRVRDQLPEGSIFIAVQTVAATPITAPLDAADVWVVWRDPAVAADELQAQSGECPAALSVSTDTSIRCSYFRIAL